MTPSLELFLRTLRARHDLSREEEAALLSMRLSERRFERNEIVIHAGQPLDSSLLLISGFALRSKIAEDGTRQIVEINVAGDFVDLHGFILKKLEHEIVAAARCVIAVVPHHEIKRVTEAFPRLARAMWFQTLIDGANHREWMLVLGKKRSRSRIAQLFCELQVRLAVVGLANEQGYALPLNQHELADITGMTAVHLNRCLRELRDAGLVSFRGGQVEIQDFDALARQAQFDANYLHLGRHEI